MIKTKTLALTWGYLAFLMLITLSLNANAESAVTLNQQFKKAYGSYQAAVKSKNVPDQLKYAKEAYQLGIKFYGDSDINTANLALILAQEYLNKNQRKRAAPLLLSTVDVFKSEFGNSAVELAEIYLLLGQALTNTERKKSINYFQKAIGIADKHEKEHPYFNANIQLEAGMALLGEKTRKSNVILKAQAFFIEHLPENDIRVVNANFYAGKYYLTRRKYDSAIENFKANLPVFKSLKGATHPLELNTHAFLINALERSGESDEATKHCVAIGSMTPWNNNQEQRPLFRVNPIYPADSARRGKSGWVKLGFTISEAGTVLASDIIESKGGRNFEKSALAALKKWRYAPKFKDGKPVEAYSTVRLDFKLGKG